MPLENRNELKQELRQAPVILIGTSREAQEMRDFAKKVGETDHTVLLQGETGTGKDHLAELIHQEGRQSMAFVPVDCGSMSETLSESELFGHAQGAYTDAHTAKQGLVQVAEDGTLFFNEIANMSLSLQAKFLRILEKRSFRAVGATKEMPVNTRIIAATNVDLKKAVVRGAFRSDLYYRLDVITFTVLPLRKHLEDVPSLIQHFSGLKVDEPLNFDPEAMAAMKYYHWPGNIRELKHAVERAKFLATGKEMIGVKHVKPYLAGVRNTEFPTLNELERNYLSELLKHTGGNVSRAKAIAGIARQTIYRKIEEFGLQTLVNSLKES